MNKLATFFSKRKLLTYSLMMSSLTKEDYFDHNSCRLAEEERRQRGALLLNANWPISVIYADNAVQTHSIRHQKKSVLFCFLFFSTKTIKLLTKIFELNSRPQLRSPTQDICKQTCVTRVFFLPLFSHNFEDQLSPNLYRFVILCIILSVNTGLWQLPKASSVFKGEPPVDSL